MRLTVFSIISLSLFIFGEVEVFEALVLQDFYTFGANEGDRVVPKNDDGSSGKVPIRIPFPFFDHNQDSLFVSIAFSAS